MMERRTNESPMDFEWERNSTPNPNSPWIPKSGRNPQAFRVQNNFISPTKPSAFAPPPSFLATPTKQHGSDPPRPPVFTTNDTFEKWNHQPPPTSSLFTEARRGPPMLNRDPFFSPVSPDPHNDSDSTTDVTPSLHGLRLTGAAKDILSTTTERVPGRGELRRGNFLSEATRKRVTKRRQKSFSERDLFGTPFRSSNRSDYDDEDEDDDRSLLSGDDHHHPGRGGRKIPQRVKPTAGRSKWDHHFPVLVASYLQLFFNISIVMILLYLLVSFLRTVQADVDTKVKQLSSKRLLEIDDCAHRFTMNRCDSGYRVPALESQCLEWEACMNSDPGDLGRARVSAQTFAEILNSLIEPISYKAMVFFLILVFGITYITNTAFGMYRHKMTSRDPDFSHPHPPLPNPHPVAVPHTPIHPAWNAHPVFSMTPGMHSVLPAGGGLGGVGGGSLLFTSGKKGEKEAGAGGDGSPKKLKM